MKLLSIHNHKAVRMTVILIVAVCIDVSAQLEPLSTQYLNSQLMINPGYAGTRNAFSVNMGTRQQWMGIKGAPVNYTLSVSTPLNKSMASVGGAVSVYKAGPVQNSYLDLYYAYLIRINHNTFISFGLSGQVNLYGFSDQTFDLIDENDPYFVFDVKNKVNANAGAGVFLYTPKFYLGLSVPHILATKYKTKEDEDLISGLDRHYYLTSGYVIDMNKKMYLKPSFLFRYAESGLYSLDVNAQMYFNHTFWIGTSYRINKTVAFMGGVLISKTLAVTYSYDFPLPDEPYIRNGSHEITLVFDTSKWLKKNKDRMFRKKKAKKDEEEGIKSIRYF